MSGLYGSFLIPDSKNYELYYEKFRSRVSNLTEVASITNRTIHKKYPELSELTHVSFPNIVICSTRYFNDLIRIKAMHNIERMNHSKMFSYTAKWLAANPAIVSTATPSQFGKLSKNERKVVLNANTVLISNVATYFFNEICFIEEEKQDKITKEIEYLLKTQLFEEHCVSSLLGNIV